jgi:hypothetical protein
VTNVYSTVNLGRARNFRNLSTSTLSPETIGFLEHSIRHCVKNHVACNPASNAPPTRLLQIVHHSSSVQGQDGVIRLVDGNTSVGRGYLTLSHCWGKAQLKVLTKDTEAELRAGISTQTLPKTFRDAIYVCSQLEQQYLWIDSLCIRQDDATDWDTESAQMHVVYANAISNIAATGAVDSSVGLFFDRNPLAHQPFRISTGTAGKEKWLCLPDWSEYTVSQSPLNRRSWVVQERLLSCRIMHFTSVGVYWDCNESKASELYPTHGPASGEYDFKESSYLKDRLGIFAALTKLNLANKITESSLHHIVWTTFVRAYSMCGLTNEGDKLIAFNGIAQRMIHCMGAKVTCGLWEQYMIEELQWNVINSYTDRQDAPFVRQWRAPSWSWANGDHRLSTFPFAASHWNCTHRRNTAQIVHIEAETLPNGKVASATLTLRGNIISVNIRSEEGPQFTVDKGLTVATCANKWYQIDSIAFIFDRLPQLPHAEELTLVGLSRCRCTRLTRSQREENSDLRQENPFVSVLMLRRAPTNPPTYSRAGILGLEGDACKLYDDHVPSTTEDLILV